MKQLGLVGTLVASQPVDVALEAPPPAPHSRALDDARTFLTSDEGAPLADWYDWALRTPGGKNPYTSEVNIPEFEAEPGQSHDSYAQALTELGLTPVRVGAAQHNYDWAEDAVLAVEPTPGTNAQPGDEVRNTSNPKTDAHEPGCELSAPLGRDPAPERGTDVALRYVVKLTELGYPSRSRACTKATRSKRCSGTGGSPKASTAGAGGTFWRSTAGAQPIARLREWHWRPLSASLAKVIGTRTWECIPGEERDTLRPRRRRRESAGIVGTRPARDRGFVRAASRMNPQEWEQACLAEVRRLLADTTKITLRGTTIHDIRLEGSKPETKLIIDLTVWGDDRTLVYDMWTVFEGAPGIMESPYMVGGLVKMWVGEEQ